MRQMIGRQTTVAACETVQEDTVACETRVAQESLARVDEPVTDSAVVPVDDQCAECVEEEPADCVQLDTTVTCVDVSTQTLDPTETLGEDLEAARREIISLREALEEARGRAEVSGDTMAELLRCAKAETTRREVAVEHIRALLAQL